MFPRKTILLAASSSAISLFMALINEYFTDYMVSHISLNSLTIILAITSLCLIILALKSLQHYLSMVSILMALVKKRIIDCQTYRLILIDQFSDLLKGLELDLRTYDEDHTWTIERWRDFFSKNPKIAYGLKKKEDIEFNEPLGGISVFPLTEKSYYSLIRGDIDEMDLTGEGLMSPSEESECRHWIIPGVILFNRGKSLMPAGVMVYSFVRQMSERVSFPVTFLAYAYSDMGEKLLKRFKFKNVVGNPHKLYKKTFSSIGELNEILPFSVNTDTSH